MFLQGTRVLISGVISGTISRVSVLIASDLVPLTPAVVTPEPSSLGENIIGTLHCCKVAGSSTEIQVDIVLIRMLVVKP